MSYGRTCEASIDGLFRWRLDAWWGDGPRLAWMMLNPSVATHTTNDPTFLRVVGFTKRLGYPGLTIVNVHPYRSPQPHRLWEWLDHFRFAGDSAIHYERDRAAIGRNAVAIAAASAEAGAHIVAFGCDAYQRGSLRHLSMEMLAGAVRSFGPASCLRMTSDGWPMHPLARGRNRIPDDALPLAWEWPRAVRY